MSRILKWLAVLSALGFPIALVGYRLGLYHFGIGFKILNYSFYLAAIVLIVGVIVFFVHKRSNPTSSKNAIIASAICLIPIIGLGTQVLVASSVPAIHNVSTDTVNPPQFEAIVAIRAEGTNPLAYEVANGNLGEIQQAAYPNIKTIITNDDMQQAFEKSIEVAMSLGWEIVNKDASKGIIEATQTTTLWQFKDDIVIRLTTDTQTPGTVNIDLRSVSRIGQSDFGVNAKRIQSFIDEFSS